MTRYTAPERCLAPETLALMASGQLPADEQATAQQHIAECRDCYEVLMDLTEPVSAATAAPPTVAAHAARPNNIIVWSRRPIIVWSGVAATIALAAVLTPRLLGGPDREVNNAVATLARSIEGTRPAVGRLSGGFDWGTVPAITRGAASDSSAAGVTRGASGKELPLAVQDAVLTIKKLASAEKTVRSLDAAGVAHLVAGDIDASIAALEEAVALDGKDGADVRVRADLAAARFEKWRRTLAPIDATATLDAAEHALLLAPKDPVAQFNHALAVEALGMKDAAIRSWNAYLAIDSSSKWAGEAREHIAKLNGSSGALPSASAAMTSPFHLPPTASPRQKTCFANATQLIADSHAAFDMSNVSESDRLARSALEQFRCAGAPTLDADAQIIYTEYTLGKVLSADVLTAFVADAERRGYFDAAGRVQWIRGLTAGRAGQLQHAEDYYASGRASFERAGNTGMAAALLVTLSSNSSARGDMPETWVRLAQAFPAVLGGPPRRRHIALSAASLAATDSGFDGAAKFFADAVVASDLATTTDPVLIMGAYVRSVTAALRLGDAATALTQLERARALNATITNEKTRDGYGAELDELAGSLLIERDPVKAIASLSSALETQVRLKRFVRRAKILLYRGRAQRAAGDAPAAERDWMDGVQALEDQRPELRDAQQRIDHLDQVWDLFRELIAVRASDPLRSFEIAERFRGRALLDALTADQQRTPLAGAALHNWLPEDVAVVAFTVLPDRLFRWTITRAGVALDQRPVTAAALAQLVDQFRRSLASPGSDPSTDRRAVELAQHLLPALEASRVKRLVFLPDGALFATPFAALPSSGRRLVVDDFTVSVAPSITILRRSVDAAPAPHIDAKRALLIAAGDANPAEALPALPGAGVEVSAIASIYPRRTVLQGPAAHKRAVLAALPLADIVHFAGHAVADSTMPSRSRLYASPSENGASIAFDDLRRTAIKPRAVVVLSACDAARGRVFKTEGAVGLAYPFLANGASAVIAALWQIDDATPPTLWQSFHARVNAGASPDVALAESQRMLRRNGAAPSIWAAFESVGGLARQ